MNNYNKSYKKQKNKTYVKPYVDNQRDTRRKKNKAKKAYRQKLVRGQLFDHVDSRVPISGILDKVCLYTTMQSNKAVLFTDCVVMGEYYEQHFWIILSEDVRQKLLMSCGDVRIYFTGVLHLYTSRNDHESDKIGVQHIQLSTELPNKD